MVHPQRKLQPQLKQLKLHGNLQPLATSSGEPERCGELLHDPTTLSARNTNF
jgi:hypothetical protein